MRRGSKIPEEKNSLSRGKHGEKEPWLRLVPLVPQFPLIGAEWMNEIVLIALMSVEVFSDDFAIGRSSTCDQKFLMVELSNKHCCFSKVLWFLALSHTIQRQDS